MSAASASEDALLILDRIDKQRAEIERLKDELTLRTSDICAYLNTVSSHEAMISRLNAALERKNGYIENLETKLRKVREAAR